MNRIPGRGPLLLLLLCVVPAFGGTLRLISFLGGPELMPEPTRFEPFAISIAWHIVSVIFFSVLGALQFSEGIRRRWPAWHRRVGWLVTIAGLSTGASGLWLTTFFTPGEFDGPLLYWIRWAAGSGMIVSIGLGIWSIQRRNILAHKAWMMRGYALGLGAGTQVFTLLPFTAIEAMHNTTGRTIGMAMGWIINLLVVEWLLRRKTQRSRTKRAA